MAASGEYDHPVVGMRLEIAGRAFRHAFVPQQLHLQETFEAPVLDLGVVFEDLLETFFVRRVRTIDLLGNLCSLLITQTFDAFSSHLFRELDGQIEGDRTAVDSLVRS